MCTPGKNKQILRLESQSLYRLDCLNENKWITDFPTGSVPMAVYLAGEYFWYIELWLYSTFVLREWSRFFISLMNLTIYFFSLVLTYFEITI